MAVEQSSQTWRAVKAFAEQEIGDALANLETKGLGVEETEYLRGRIAAMRDLLRLPAPRLPASEPADYGLGTQF